MTGALSRSGHPASPSTLDAALEYAAAGLVPIPLHPRSKKPVGEEWQKIDPAEARDPDKIRRRWAATSGANVGLLHGHETVAIDIDGEGGRRVLAQYEARLGKLPPTLTVRSGREDGGRHLIFRHSGPPVRSIPLRAPEGDGQMEILSRGKQTVAPPSIHPDTGVAYVLESALDSIADFPEAWAVEFQKAPKRTVRTAAAASVGPTATSGRHGSAYARAAMEREVAAVRNAPPGSRNDQLNRSAFSLGQLVVLGLLDEAEVVLCLTEAAKMAGDGGSGEDEKIAGTIRSGLEAGKLQPRETPQAKSRTRQSVPQAAPCPAPQPAPPTAAEIGADGMPATAAVDKKRSPALIGGRDVLVPGPHTFDPDLRSPDYLEIGTDVFADAALSLIPRGTLYRRAEIVGEVRDAAFHALDEIDLRTIIDAHAQLRVGVKKENKQTGEITFSEVFRPCSSDNAKLVASAAARNGTVPVLDGITLAPVLRPDGTVLDVPGYDPELRVLYAPTREYPRVPDNPTDSDARDAFAEMLAPFAQFPLESDDENGHGPDRAALAGYMLTFAARSAFDGPCPGFAASSHINGDGKGLLLKSAAIAMTGAQPDPMPPITKEEELRKRVLATLLAGDRCSHTDNMPDGSILQSPTFAALLTSDRWKDRVLGVSENASLPVRTVFVWTGINLEVSVENARRVFVLKIVPGLEKPQERTFEIDNLEEYAREHHPRLLRAALTVLRRFALIGRKVEGLRPLGSYNGWSRQVRACVVWATSLSGWKSDPVVLMDRSRAAAPERENLGGLHAAWESTLGKHRVTSTEILREAGRSEVLREALQEIDATDRTGKLTAKSIGERLRGLKGRIVDGRRILREPVGAHGGKAVWRLAVEASPSGPSGGPSTENRTGDSAKAASEGVEGVETPGGGLVSRARARARPRARAETHMRPRAPGPSGPSGPSTADLALVHDGLQLEARAHG